MKAYKREYIVEEGPVRPWPYWGVALFAACIGSWVGLIGAVKFLAAL